MGKELSPTDTIVTGEDGYCKFSVEGVGTFEIKSNSKVAISNLILGIPQPAITMDITKGSLSAMVRPGNTPNVSVVSPSAIINATGTKFEVAYSEENDSTDVYVFGGEVEVSDENGNNITTVKSFQSTTVDTDGSPTTPSSIPMNIYLDNINKVWLILGIILYIITLLLFFVTVVFLFKKKYLIGCISLALEGAIFIGATISTLVSLNFGWESMI